MADTNVEATLLSDCEGAPTDDFATLLDHRIAGQANDELATFRDRGANAERVLADPNDLAAEAGPRAPDGRLVLALLDVRSAVVGEADTRHCRAR